MAKTILESSDQVLLTTEKLCKSFGGIHAVKEISLAVRVGLIKGIIGPNGAGKTTLFNLITGFYVADSGVINFKGQRLNGFSPHQVAESGIARTFQNVELFDRMSVLENVMVGRHPRTKAGFIGAAFRLSGARREEELIREKAAEILEFVGLGERAHRPSSELPFGHQRVLEIGRALATEPRLLLLDEPASGLNASETRELGRLICRIRDAGIAVVLVEHDMSLTMEICDEILVMDYGRTLAEGTPRQIQENPMVIAAYLGEETIA
ncbi:MAG: ABC transporter ATP-binding protein [Deltaproteobacteria bacterium]|nr:MAG: ABC transporter ATP-binding protein [Deltaproteobacteria bacterium]